MASRRPINSTIQLLVNNKKVPILPQWVSRWSFFSDITSEIGDNHVIEWTYTGEEELKLWLKLNERMDRFDSVNGLQEENTI